MARTDIQSNRKGQQALPRRCLLRSDTRNPLIAFGSLVGLTCICIVAATTGCLEQNAGRSHYLPAPLRDDFPYELRFFNSKVWEPDNFEINLDGELHRIVLVACEMPPLNHPQRQQTIDSLRDLVGHANGRAIVQGRDRFQREIAQVFVSAGNSNNASKNTTEETQEIDVGLRLIEMGLARCSLAGSDLSEDYRKAEAAARAERKGIWK